MLDPRPSEPVKDFATPFTSTPARLKEPDRERKYEARSVKTNEKATDPVNDLKQEAFSEKIEDMPTELPKNLPILFDTVAVQAIDPENDRKYPAFSAKLDARFSDALASRRYDDLPARSDVCVSMSSRLLKKETPLARFEAEVKAPAIDLNSELFSVSVVADPTAANRFSVLPVKSELPIVINPVSVLRYENFCVRAEAAPTDAVKDLGKFLPIELALVTEALRALNNVRLLATLVLSPTDALGVRKREVFSANPELRDRDPLTALK